MHPALHVNSKASVYGLDATKVVIIFEKNKILWKKNILRAKKVKESWIYTESAKYIHYY